MSAACLPSDFSTLVTSPFSNLGGLISTDGGAAGGALSFGGSAFGGSAGGASPCGGGGSQPASRSSGDRQRMKPRCGSVSSPYGQRGPASAGPLPAASSAF